MNILIVEDDPALGGLLREFLQQLKHETVVVCANGKDALKAIGSGYIYDCVFMDLRLPDTDGLQLLDVIKNQDPSLPVVMMSGYPTMDYIIEAMRKGASDFLTKPFTLQDMAIALEKVTKERSLLLENLSLKLESQARKQLEVVNRELEEKIDEQTKLFEISREIDEIRSSEDLYSHIVYLASRLTHSKRIGFFIVPPDQQNLILISECGISREQSGRLLMGTPDTHVREMLSSGCTCTTLKAENLFDKAVAIDQMSETPEFSCWPVRIRGELFGFLAAARNGNGGTGSRTELKLIDFLVKKSALAIENMALYESMTSNFYGILKSLVNALEAKDLYTGKHSERVTKYALDISSRLGCSEDQVEALRTVGYLHDIGKIGIADSILNKPASLTMEEYEQVKLHPTIGDSIVSELGLSPEERAIIRHHHERWDGRGYPDGLSGMDIPLLARIVMVADAFDAMTSKRAYRNSMSRSDALRELQENRGRQFDGDVVDAFIEAQERPGSEE